MSIYIVFAYVPVGVVCWLALSFCLCYMNTLPVALSATPTLIHFELSDKFLVEAT